MTKTYCDKCGKEMLPSEDRIIKYYWLDKDNYYKKYQRYIEVCIDCHSKIVEFLETYEGE